MRIMQVIPSIGIVTMAAFAGNAHALTITKLGTGTANLAHGKTISGRTYTDLTDPENNATSLGFNLNGTVTASFNSGNTPPPITTPAQNAHNLFVNNVSSGNKWCCNGPTQNVTFQFSGGNAFAVDAFTLTSGGDVPGRDPISFTLLGSNDGTSFTPFFNFVSTTTSGTSDIWNARNQVVLFNDIGNTTAFKHVRFQVNSTISGFQLDEIEYFATGFTGGPNIGAITAPGRIITGLASGTQQVGGLFDLTDPESNGVPANYNPPASLGGFDATFSSTNQPGFGAGQNSFYVFDNTISGQSKWCCTGPTGAGHNLDANLVAGPHLLTAFTLTSSNDSPSRDPRIFQILGSNDGINFDVIYAFDGINNSFADLFPLRNQTRLFQDGVDGVQFLSQKAYSIFRFNVSATLSGFALGEIEYFGSPISIPEPATATLGLFSVAGLMMRRRRMA